MSPGTVSHNCVVCEIQRFSGKFKGENKVRERKTGDEESVREREKTDRQKMGEPEKKGRERGKKARDD